MRIAQIAPLEEPVPPVKYGGIERMVAWLVDGLCELGTDVTLFASADSHTKARLVPCRDKATRLDPERSDLLAAVLMQFETVRAMADEFDILHFHCDTLHIPMFGSWSHKTITTMHSRMDSKDFRLFFQMFRQFPLVSVSAAQRHPLPRANWRCTVPHGLPKQLYRLQATPAPASYLAFLGRFAPEKGFEHAVAIAERVGLPLKVAAKKCAFHSDYYENTVRPLLDKPFVDYIGEVDDCQKQEFLGNAAALLFPIQWPEPFGLVQIEAMACGTPVLAFANGAATEVIDPGLTGALVNNVDEAVRALPDVLRLDRRVVREVFEERFTARQMAAAYLKLYGEQTRVARALRPVAKAATPLVRPRLSLSPAGLGSVVQG